VGAALAAIVTWRLSVTSIRFLAPALVFAAAQVAYAQDFNAARIVTEKIRDGFYVMLAEGGDVVAGNMAVSIGPQGVLVVDDQFPEMAPKYKAAIRELGGSEKIAFAINTHWHFDHSNGNQTLGPEGTWFVAQELSREMMLKDNVINLVNRQREQPPHPVIALPVVTYDRSMRFHFNGQRIDLLHFGSAHTTGDTAVIFREHNVVHLGDVLNMAGYPFIDADNGGTLPGVIDFCAGVLEEINETTVVIPGHGPVSDYQGLADYVTMLKTIRDRIQSLIATGASLEQVIAARPTAEWDEERGDPALLIDRAYASMTP
jgi:glyoxylase-like metal-dependent hydrolase (beta-lactamase superfamily II)